MDVTAILLDILIVLVAAKVAVEIAERVGRPGGGGGDRRRHDHRPVDARSRRIGDETLSVLGELGVILLLLGVGMEMDLGELGAVGRAAMSVAVIGVVVPDGGWVRRRERARSRQQSGVVHRRRARPPPASGSPPASSAICSALATVEARTVLGAAVADDVLGLVILTVVVRLVSEGSVSIADIAVIVAVAVGFLVVTAALGSRFAPGLFQSPRPAREVGRHAGGVGAGVHARVRRARRRGEARSRSSARSSPVWRLSGSSAKERIQRELAPVGHLFIPVFFLGIGIEVEVESFVEPEVLGIAAALLVVAVIGKLVAAVGVFGSPGDKWLIGLGMIPRGEVGLIFATIGLNEGHPRRRTCTPRCSWWCWSRR